MSTLIFLKDNFIYFQLQAKRKEHDSSKKVEIGSVFDLKTAFSMTMYAQDTREAKISIFV